MDGGPVHMPPAHLAHPGAHKTGNQVICGKIMKWIKLVIGGRLWCSSAHQDPIPPFLAQQHPEAPWTTAGIGLRKPMAD